MMAIGKVGGVGASGYVRPIVRRLATDPAEHDTFVLRGIVRSVELSQRRFALAQDGRAYNVGWSATTEFIGAEASAMQGLEVCVKGHLMSSDFQADSIAAVL